MFFVYETERQQREHIPDEGVNLGGLDVVQLVDGLLDLVLVGLQVNNEHQGVGVLLLDLGDGSFRGNRALDDTVGIELGAAATRASANAQKRSTTKRRT
jgi:hypothetical protein